MQISPHCDVLIIGSGASGLIAAIDLARAGLKVLIITKDAVTESSSIYAQGGIAVPLASGDSPEKHIKDTLKVGLGHCDKKAVEFYINSIIPSIHKLSDWGINFIGLENGKLKSENYLGQEGAHSARRILRVGGDLSGRVLMKSLLETACRHPKISISQGTTLLQLCTNSSEEVTGGIFQDINHNIFCLYSLCTILASGGFSSIFSKSTNPYTSTGDGIIAAGKLKAKLKDLKFVQFHPTALNVKPLFLLSEALRGEGAILLNGKHERFMNQYAPQELELASRQIVSLAVWTEIKKTGSAYLDLRHLDKSFVRERFSGIYEYCLDKGFDLNKDLAPITPATHYTIGGVEIDLNARTSLKNLWAIGETACSGLHGADRLASNSLLECIVSAFSASQSIQGAIIKKDLEEFNFQIEEKDLSSINTREISKNLKSKLWDFASFEREKGNLQDLLIYIKQLKDEMPKGLSNNFEVNELVKQIYMSELFVENLIQGR